MNNVPSGIQFFLREGLDRNVHFENDARDLAWYIWKDR